MLKGIYLGANIARHKDYNIIYQDIDKNCEPDIIGDMLDIDLIDYDYIICTPPCNYWSKLNMYYYCSYYAWKTSNLLPLMIIKLSRLKKPFIIENVINRKRFENAGIYKLIQHYGLQTVEVGRHTYITNTKYDLFCEQHQDFINGGIRINNDGYNQGGSNVHIVIEKWLKQLHDNNCCS